MFRSNGFPGMSGQFKSSSIDIEDLFEDTPHRETALIGPNRQDEELELNPENENVSENHRQPDRRKRWTNICGLCFVLAIVFGGGFLVGVIFQGKDTLHTDPDDARPRIGGLQQISAQSPFDDNFTLTSTEESVSEDLGYLERLGLKFFLSASNSTCPQEVCHTCTTTVYIDSAPNIEPEGDCNRTRNTKNESCYMCGRLCKSFHDVLRDGCRRDQPSCADLTKMADLNNYCNGGYSVFDKDRSRRPVAEQLRCKCPHGQSGERCENVAETENVLCSCYKDRFKLQETQPEFRVPRCENVSYSNDTRCLHFTKRETCYCVSIEDSDTKNLYTNCDIFDTNSDDNENNDDSTADDSLDREGRDTNDANMGRQTNHAERNSVNSSLQLLVVLFISRKVLLHVHEPT